MNYYFFRPPRPPNYDSAQSHRSSPANNNHRSSPLTSNINQRSSPSNNNFVWPPKYNSTPVTASNSPLRNFGPPHFHNTLGLPVTSTQYKSPYAVPQSSSGSSASIPQNGGFKPTALPVSFSLNAFLSADIFMAPFFCSRRCWSNTCSPRNGVLLWPMEIAKDRLYHRPILNTIWTSAYVTDLCHLATKWVPNYDNLSVLKIFVAYFYWTLTEILRIQNLYFGDLWP